MIDTLGIPDPDTSTLEGYNDIVMAARNSDGINALIVAVHFGVGRELILLDFEAYLIILEEFSRPPLLDDSPLPRPGSAWLDRSSVSG